MWDRFQNAARGGTSFQGMSGRKSSEEATDQTWLDQLRADVAVVVRTTRQQMAETVLGIARDADVRLKQETDSAQPGDLVIVDHLYPEPPTSHFGDIVVIGMPGEERSMLLCLRRFGAAHAVVLPPGRDWLLQFILQSSGGCRDANAGVIASGPKARTVSGQHPGWAECDPRLGDVPAAPDETVDHTRVDEASLVGAGVLPAPVAKKGSHAGLCIGVIPACGGCGASTVTVALGLAAARSGDALVIDADPWGQGLGVSLGSDSPEFAGWRAIAPDTQQLDAAELRAALPRDPGFWVLGGAASVAGDIPEALPAVTAAGRDGFDITVVDLGRTTAGVEAARNCDVVVVVLHTTLAGVLGARRLIERLSESPGAVGPVRVALACRDVGGLTPQDIEEYLGHEIVLTLGNSRLIAERAAAGELVQGRSGRRLSAWGDRLLAVLT